VYSTCIYCNRSLGSNEAIEAFPVGKRLAFDAVKGRLWAVCPHCTRWNLTPLEERWEAVEACERLTRSLTARAATDTVALFKAPDSTLLIRLGEALPPEIAAWRYSREYARRLARTVAIGAAASAAVAGAWFAGFVGVGAPSFGLVWIVGVNGLNIARFVRRGVGTVAVRGADGKRYTVSRGEFDQVQLMKGAAPYGWELYVKHTYGHFTLAGDAAERALGRLMVSINAIGALPATVRDATALAQGGGRESLLRVFAEASEISAGDYFRLLRAQRAGTDIEGRRPGDAGYNEWDQSTKSGKHLRNNGALYNLGASHRLAIEMSLHEESERRAMEHELAPLEAAWREAEEIAGIADSLLTPPSVASELARLKSRRAGTR
jgi:hypothetical protein